MLTAKTVSIQFIDVGNYTTFKQVKCVTIIKTSYIIGTISAYNIYI